MCVSALIVLGDKIRHKIDEQIQEQWLMSYIGEYGDLLCKLIDSNHVTALPPTSFVPTPHYLFVP